VAGVLPADKYTKPPTNAQLAYVADQGALGLGLAAIWTPPPLDLVVALSAAGFKTTSYLLVPPTPAGALYDTATVIGGAYLPQTQWIQTSFTIGTSLLRLYVLPSQGNSNNQPSCTPPRKC
jgi:hypothetical protein